MRPITDASASSPATPRPADEHDEADVAMHRSAPEADPTCLYGLIGDVARAGSDGTETNAYAIAANFMAYPPPKTKPLCRVHRYAESVTAVSPPRFADGNTALHNVSARNGLQHCHQLIGGSETPTLQPRWRTACQCFQFFGWISTEIHLGTLHAGMPQPK